MLCDYSKVLITEPARAIAEGKAMYEIVRNNDLKWAGMFVDSLDGPAGWKAMLNKAVTLQDLLNLRNEYQRLAKEDAEAAAEVEGDGESLEAIEQVATVWQEYLSVYFDSCCRALGVIPAMVRPGFARANDVAQR